MAICSAAPSSNTSTQAHMDLPTWDEKAGKWYDAEI